MYLLANLAPQCYEKSEHVQDVMHALVEGGADVRAVDEQGLSALLNAVKVGRRSSS